MYEQFYGLRDKPFSMLPDHEFLFLSKKHQSALTLLEYGLMNNVGFCVISGETGAGKTTLLRKLLGRIDASYRVGMITNTHQSFGNLLDWVLSAFNLHDPNLSQVEMHQKLMDFLIAEYANKRKVLLIVDEAQNMNAATLEELRMLSNVNSEKDQLMQVILAGQPALKKTLRIPELMQFAQRIGVDFHLDDLDVNETCHYIQHRLQTAGATRNVFTPAACARIHGYSGGTPRLINLLCDTVMVYGFADQRETIDVDLVDEMVQERMKDSVVPLVDRADFDDLSDEEMQALEADFPWIEEASSEADSGAVPPADKAAIEEPGGVDSRAETGFEQIDEANVSEPDTSELSIEKQAESEGETLVSQSSVIGKSTATQSQPVQSSVHVLNEIEQMDEPVIPVSSGYGWIYTGIAILLFAIAFFLFQSDLIVSSEKTVTTLSQQAVPAEKKTVDFVRIQKRQQAIETAERIRQQAQRAREEAERRLQQAEQQIRAEQLLAQERKRQQQVAAQKKAERRQAEAVKKREAETRLREQAKRRANQQARLDRQRLVENKPAKVEPAKVKQEQSELGNQPARKKEAAVGTAVEAQVPVQSIPRQPMTEEVRGEAVTAVSGASRKQAEARLLEAQAEVMSDAALMQTQKKTKKFDSTECSGPAARFKSFCR